VQRECISTIRSGVAIVILLDSAIVNTQFPLAIHATDRSEVATLPDVEDLATAEAAL
jgi:hypothetical protein